jgi:hypothetical protein
VYLDKCASPVDDEVLWYVLYVAKKKRIGAGGDRSNSAITISPTNARLGSRAGC